MKALFPFDLYFRDRVVAKARERAGELFEAYYFNKRSVRSREKIEQLANQEAERFHRSGRIFLLLKASWTGTPAQVTHAYRATFIDHYNYMAKQNREKTDDQPLSF